MCASSSRWRLAWQELAEKPTSVESVEHTVNRGTIPFNVIIRSTLPADFNYQMTNLSVRIGQGAIYVRGNIVAPRGTPPGLIKRRNVGVIRDKLADVVQRPVALEFGIIHETIVRSPEGT